MRIFQCTKYDDAFVHNVKCQLKPYMLLSLQPHMLHSVYNLTCYIHSTALHATLSLQPYMPHSAYSLTCYTQPTTLHATLSTYTLLSVYNLKTLCCYI